VLPGFEPSPTILQHSKGLHFGQKILTIGRDIPRDTLITFVVPMSTKIEKPVIGKHTVA
jgi:hypothetical protein